MCSIIKILGILSLLLDTSSILVTAGICGRKLKMKQHAGYYYTYPTLHGGDDCEDDSVSSRRMKKRSMSKGRSYHKIEGYYVFLNIVNLAFQQPFSPFFIMVHDSSIIPVYTLGQAPSANLTILAEDGDPNPLVRQYSGQSGVLSAVSFSKGSPFFVGQELIIPVYVTDRFSHVTIAAKALNTNDVFVALNGVFVQPGNSFTVPAYDAGSEENNELCTSIPGPACALVPGNVRSLNGEGVIHVARGIHGVGNLTAADYDWRNPMMLVTVD